MAVAEAAYGPDHPRTAFRRHSLGFCLLHPQGDPALARQHLERALVIDQASLGPHHPRVVTDLRHLGQALQQLGDLDAARQQLERARILGEGVWGPDHPSMALTLSSLGSLLHKQGDLAGARQHFEQALAIYKAAWAPDHYYVAGEFFNLGEVLRDLEDLARETRPALFKTWSAPSPSGRPAWAQSTRTRRQLRASSRICKARPSYLRKALHGLLSTGTPGQRADRHATPAARPDIRLLRTHQRSTHRSDACARHQLPDGSRQSSSGRSIR